MSAETPMDAVSRLVVEVTVAFVVLARWTAKKGQENAIAAILESLIPLSRQEPGNLGYEVNVSSSAPQVFLLYEKYVDPEAFQAHRDTGHFRRLVLGEAMPLLESREVETFIPLGSG
jgi:quinol monooxygenase YgiN